MHRALQSHFTLLFCLCFTVLARSQAQPQLIAPRYEPTLILPEQISQLAGIENPIVDSLGFLWFVSHNGLHRYDGQDLITLNNDGVPGRLSMTREGDGYTALVSADGLHLYAQERQSGHWVVVDVRTLQRVRYLDFGEVDYSELTYAEPGGEIYQVRRKHTPGTSSEVLCLSCDSLNAFELSRITSLHDYRWFDDAHWIKSDPDIWRVPYDFSKQELITKARYLYFSSGLADSLYLSHSQRTELAVYDERSDEFRSYPIPERFKDHWYRSFKIKEKVWFVDQQLGVFLWDISNHTLEDYSDVLTDVLSSQSPMSVSAPLTSMLQLDDGTFFMHGFNQLVQFTPKILDEEYFLRPINSGKGITSVREIAEDNDGNIYASYYCGVAVKPFGTDRFIDFRGTRDAPKADESTYGLTLWKDHLIWNNVVFDLQSDNEFFIDFDQYGSSWTHCLVGDTLWYHWYGRQEFGKYDLAGKDNKTLIHDFPKGLQLVTTILHDSTDHTFWLSTKTNGIINVGPNGRMIDTFTQMQLGITPPHYYVHDLSKRGDTIWFGSRLGLGMINTSTLEAKHFKNPFVTSTGDLQLRWIFSIYEKDDGNFLLGTSRGISHFNTRTFQFRNLDDSHPLANKEFNRNAQFRASDCRYYFGTVNGLYSFTEDELIFEASPDFVYQPQINKVSIYRANNPEPRIIAPGLPDKGGIKLHSEESTLKLTFSSPSFTETVFYDYRIPQLNEQWSTAKPEGSLEILSMPAGDYDIEIRASTTPGSEHFGLRSIPVSKSQIWYKRAWVITIFVLVLILLITALLRWRYQLKLMRQRELETLRTKISSDLHDDVGSILSGLAMQSEMMTYTSKDPADKASLAQISELSRDAMERMRDTVWAIDSRKDHYGNLIDRMRAFAERMLPKKGIEHSFAVDGIDPQQFVSPAVRQSFYLVFKEAITNITKHSNASNVAITFIKKESAIALSIHDDGDKFVTTNSDGLGLSNMKMRAKQIGAEVQTNFSGGFRVSLILPL